ncbi:toxin B domain protein, partial [Escherichia coli PA31]
MLVLMLNMAKFKREKGTLSIKKMMISHPDLNFT